MKNKLRRAGLVSLSLGALGCGEPASPDPVAPQTLFGTTPADGGAGEGWRAFLDPKELHRAWVPDPDSPWRAYYKPTLIAALSTVRAAARPLEDAERPASEEAALRFGAGVDLHGAAVFVDLVGERSVAWGAALRRTGFVPVVTFNNWPHQFGILHLERPLGALLYYAEELSRNPLPPAAPPVFILDRSRLGQKGLDPAPRQFDNRYFHVPTDFPSAADFKRRGIERIVYVNPRGCTPGCEEDDLCEYFSELALLGFTFTYAKPGPEGTESAPAIPVARETIFTREQLSEYDRDSSLHPSLVHSYSHYWGWHTSYWDRSSGAWGGGTSHGFSS